LINPRCGCNYQIYKSIPSIVFILHKEYGSIFQYVAKDTGFYYRFYRTTNMSSHRSLIVDSVAQLSLENKSSKFLQYFGSGVMSCDRCNKNVLHIEELIQISQISRYSTDQVNDLYLYLITLNINIINPKAGE